MIRIIHTPILILLLFHTSLSAQKKETEVKFEPYHRVAIGLSHAHIRQEINPGGDTDWTLAAGWGFDYSYFINKSFALGIQLDLIVKELKVKEDADENNLPVIIERSYPLTICPVITYLPIKNLHLSLGNGTEYCPEGPLFVTTVGVEYGKELSEQYAVGVGLTYAIKWQVYDTYIFSFIISRKFKKAKSG